MTVTLILSALLIFAMRLADVSIGTVRLIVLVRGQTLLAAVLSFFSALIWILATAQVINDLQEPIKIVAYAAGFAVGTLVGALIERWIAIGNKLVRVVTPASTPQVAEAVREAGFYVTELNAEGRDGEVHICFTVVPRRQVPKLLNIVSGVNPKAFITVEDVAPVQLKSVRAVRHHHA